MGAHPRFAKIYIKAAARAERRGGAELRRELLDGLAGRVVEVGAGHGLNFAHYPSTVSEVIAVEPEPTLRDLAERAAALAPVPVTVVDGVADALPVADGAADAVVAGLVLCSVPDQATALAEMARVLRPGGELRFYEHVVARTQPGRAIQQLADRSGLWPRVAGGCHLARDTQAAIEAAGFTVQRSRRFTFDAIPHVLGTARRPGSAVASRQP